MELYNRFYSKEVSHSWTISFIESRYVFLLFTTIASHLEQGLTHSRCSVKKCVE